MVMRHSVTDGVELIERLASEFAEKVRQGQPVSMESVAAEHPTIASDIRELFPIILAMEQRKLERESALMQRRTNVQPSFERLGGYRIVREIGRGGMGIVFEAQRESNGERVAVKWLPWRGAVGVRSKERFEHEAKTVAILRHPNIVPVIDVGEDQGHSYYVMPFIEAVGLDGIIRRLNESETLLFTEEIQRKRSPETAPARSTESNLEDNAAGSENATRRGLRRNSWKVFARITAQVARALSYAHQQGILHNDIKPGNLLLDSTARVWVTDFGLAQPLDPPDDRESRTVSGTLRYMAPERFSGWFDELSDLYSLGITLYELVTRRPSFEASEGSSIICQIQSKHPVAPRSIDRGIPRDLETIILNAIHPDPDERYYAVEAFEADLLRFINGQRIRAKRPSRWRSWWRRRFRFR